MEEWNGEERRKTVQLVDTSDLLTRDELKELKTLASYAKAFRWLTTGFMAAAGFFGIDKLSEWFKH
jgi:hypothetical protein